MSTVPTTNELVHTSARDMVNKIYFRFNKIAFLNKRDTDFISTIEVKVMLSARGGDWACERSHDLVIGESCVYLVEGDRAEKKGGDIAEFMGDFSDLLFEAHKELFDRTGEYRGKVKDSSVLGHRILVIDYIYLAPGVRGSGLGKALVAGMLREFEDEVDIVVLKPEPLNPKCFPDGSKRIPYLNKREEKIAQKKLYNYWQQIGFKPLFKGSSFLFFSTMNEAPSPMKMVG